MSNSFVRYLLEGNNYPSNGQVVFDSSDHIRFQNGQNVSGHNYGCNPVSYTHLTLPTT